MVEIREVTILSVDPLNKRATVRFDYGTTRDPLILPDVRLSNFKGSKAAGYMPEVGEPWLAVRTSDSDAQWFLLQPRDLEGTINTELYEGDYGWSLPLGSRVILRKNGTIELYSKATSSLYLVPTENLVQIHAVDYELTTPQGSISWKPSILKIVIGHDLGESSFVMKFGSTGDVFGARDWSGEEVYGSIACGVFHVEIDKTGNISMESGDRGISVLGNMKLEVDGETTAKLHDSVVIETAELEGKTSSTLAWSAKVSIKFEAPEIRFNAQRLILTEEDGFAVDGIKLLQWLISSFRIDPSTGKIDPACLPSFLEVLNTKVLI